LFAVSASGSPALQVDFQEHLWRFLKLAGLPLALMLVGRLTQPYRFHRARADIQTAEGLLRQMMAVRATSPVERMAPLIESEYIPCYKLGSVACLLRRVATRFEATDKLAVDTSRPAQSQRRFDALCAPFRGFAGGLLLWESRDVILYAVMIVYIAFVCAGAHYFKPAPLLVLVPFFGPKSKVGRQLADLQEDIWRAQGSSVEKKGGLIPQVIEAAQTINVPMFIYLALVHCCALYALSVLILFRGVCPLFGQGMAIHGKTLVWTAFLYWVNATGITAGAHRLWAHKSYKAGLPLKIVLMLFNSVANQGSIFHWARDHRVHHLYSDTDADPHDSNRGFWYSHVGWLLVKKHPAVMEAGRGLNLSDLHSDPVVMLQKRLDPFWNLFWCFGFPSIAVQAWGDLPLYGFLVAGTLRYVMVLNATWAVNSVVHAWGVKPYNASHATTENGWVSLFALGEGWHNWHHAFDWDYAAAELGPLVQFNPTTVFIDAMCFLGLAWGRKRAHKCWELRKARWSEKSRRPIQEHLEGPPLFRRRVVTFGPTLTDEGTTNDKTKEE